jgi:hypothetical protein
MRAAGGAGALEERFELADGEVEVVQVGPGVEVVAVRARVVAGPDRAAAVDVQALGRLSWWVSLRSTHPTCCVRAEKTASMTMKQSFWRNTAP